jgi:hypothetical protein
MIFIGYIIGAILTFIIISYFNVKFDWGCDDEGLAVMASIMWPVVITVIFPIYLFMKLTGYSWKKLNKLFKSHVKK